MRKLLILRGIPGSGKSTWSKNFLRSQPPDSWVRVNKDELREMFHAREFDKKHEDFVHKIQNDLIRTSLERGLNVIVDNTHVDRASCNRLHVIAKEIGNVEVTECIFFCTLERAKEYNAKRSGKDVVPSHVIDAMYAKFLKDPLYTQQRVFETNPIGLNLVHSEPTMYLRQAPIWANDPELPPAVICDIDGTLAELNGRDPYNASICHTDAIKASVYRTLCGLWEQDIAIIFLTGRDGKHEPATRAWLDAAMNYRGHKIPYTLYMRKTGDMRKDFVIKQEAIVNEIGKNYFIEFCLEDRPRNCRMMRSLGLTVFQLGDEEF